MSKYNFISNNTEQKHNQNAEKLTHHPQRLAVKIGYKDKKWEGYNSKKFDLTDGNERVNIRNNTFMLLTLCFPPTYLYDIYKESSYIPVRMKI